MALDARAWTRADLDRLPDDGNRYELLGGELLVTPPPSDAHEAIVAWLSMRLTPFVRDNQLGMVFHPRSVIQVGDEQTEPDLMVRPIAPLRGWDRAPLPILVVEVIARSTRHRDLGSKRRFYVESGVAEYWVVDRDREQVLQIRGGEAHQVARTIRWFPPGTTAVLDVDLDAMFADVRSRS